MRGERLQVKTTGLAAEIRAQMFRVGYTSIRLLAEDAGIPRKRLLDQLTEHRPVTVDVLHAVSALLETNAPDLLRRAGEAPQPERHIVYRAYDAHRNLLYVGYTIDPTQRMISHRSQSEWYPLMATINQTAYPDSITARRAEAALIRELRPAYNRRGVAA